MRQQFFTYILAVSLASVASFGASARDTIHVVGSSTVYPFSTVVAERFGRKRL